MKEKNSNRTSGERRKFFKQCAIGGCGAALGLYTVNDLLIEGGQGGLRVGFRNDAPEKLWKWSREALWYEVQGGGIAPKVHCQLCPHDCVLGESDRGFCRTRVVKEEKLYTLAYGNPCAVHLDPVEKKPLNHFLPGTAIYSIATAGCNLRCQNCQNWSISQARPEDTKNYDFFPEALVEVCARKEIPSIAYTYSDPIVFYEYVLDTAKKAHEQNIRNVLVTAGYISPKPLRALCPFIDAANVDLKAFNDYFYRKVAGAKLEPVLRALEIMREEGVWLEVTRLIVPSLSDDMSDIRQMAKWMVKSLGPGTPLHLSRFHPDHKLRALPPTPEGVLLRAREVCLEAGLHFVYVGNLSLPQGQDTVCPACGETVVSRRGYRVIFNKLTDGYCPCGESVPGVWS